MGRYTSVLAHDIVVGDKILWNNREWLVERNYLNSQSPYAKMNLWNEEFSSKHTLYTSKHISRNTWISRVTAEELLKDKKKMVTEYLYKAKVVLGTLSTSLEALSELSQMGEQVQLGNSNIQVKRELIEEISHKDIAARIKELTEYCNKMK